MKVAGTNSIHKLIRLATLVFLLFISLVQLRAEGDSTSNEYNVKAMFVINFMKYVEWPSGNNSGVFKIGVAGESEIYDALQSMAANRNESRKIIIERAKPDVVGDFQILVISKNERSKADEWNKKYHGKGVLIISEEFKDSNSAAINLKNVDNKIRFEINNSKAKSGGVKISSRLANLAISVQP